MPKLIKNFPTPESLRPEKTALLRTARKVLEPLRGCSYVLSQHRARQNEAFEEQLNTNGNVSCTGNHSLPATAPKVVEHVPSPLKPAWQKYGAQLIVLPLAIAIIVTITRNWHGWKKGCVEQVTNDAYVRGDLTPLSTKVAGLVREVNVNDYQQVHKGDLLVQLDDDD